MVMNVGIGNPGMSMMNGISGGNSSGNVIEYYTQKYGCEDCFRKSPYPAEYPKAYIPEPKNSLKPSIFQRLMRNIFGG